MEPFIVLVKYKIKKKKLDKAKDAISEYVEAVKKHEPQTIHYKVFQDKDDNTVFVHMMSFLDKNAKKTHEKTAHLKKLKKILIPISKGKAEYTDMVEFKLINAQEKIEATNISSSHEPVK
ncbi:MAG: antibiotic biosynthesis monooxygenase [Thaumarchaeota archaeon]|nr:antibiotic biosynthesis monooxygenase [Nitrososphaerota archaeon]